MKVSVYHTKSKVLQQYIECFYYLDRSEEAITENYISLPSVFTSVSLFIGNQPKIEGNKVVLKHEESAARSVLATNFSVPKLICYEGKAKDINIYFRPLGINAFITKTLDHYVADDFNLDFFPFDDLKDWTNTLFDVNDTQKMFELLEAYLLKHFIGFDHPFLNKAIELLCLDEPIEVAEIAKACRVSQKTLIKHFQMHLTRSPSQFRKIWRFRKTLNQYHDERQKQHLTDIAYAQHYFDQSHMIKDFKALTGQSPKSFFKDLHSHPQGAIHWSNLR